MRHYKRREEAETTAVLCAQRTINLELVVGRKEIEQDRYLNQHPENTSKYPKLKNVDGATVDVSCNNPGFETVAANYLKVFDDVISAVEEKPGDVQPACDRLVAVGKMHRSKVSDMQNSAFQDMEEPFLNMVKEALQDRFNEKAEGLFRKFFQFCLKYLLEGFNG
ncbi:hypothetical protein ANCCEY_13112 [Ancylostoma ceylanicum]|uniref:Globin domain-containing protein n=1 Tax=Ancylostoma ceylanicum TaxID=53326 RepID=A0A0D6L9L0_9BILA|nr:hypothetical protein ANCCEY_13112 [Ancylostoma ceylanicum]